MKLRKLKNESGMSLVETMIVVAIINFVMSVILALSYVGATMWQKQMVRIGMERDAQAAMQVIGHHLRQASAATVAIDRLNTTEMPYSRITFKLAALPGVNYSVYEQTVMVAGKARRQLIFSEPKISGGVTVFGTHLLAADVQNVFFSFPSISNNSEVLINLSLEKTPLRGKVPVTLQTAEVVSIRNP